MGSGNFAKREHVRMALNYLDRIGVKHNSVSVTGGGHVRITWQYEGRNHQVVGSFSPRNRTLAGKSIIRDIQYTMRGKYGR